MAEGLAPTGTVSFLLTDIEASTRLWEDYPEQMAVALARHDAIVRSAITERRGYVFGTSGDGFNAAFWTAREALDAATTAQNVCPPRRGRSRSAWQCGWASTRVRLMNAAATTSGRR